MIAKVFAAFCLCCTHRDNSRCRARANIARVAFEEGAVYTLLADYMAPDSRRMVADPYSHG